MYKPLEIAVSYANDLYSGAKGIAGTIGNSLMPSGLELAVVGVSTGSSAGNYTSQASSGQAGLHGTYFMKHGQKGPNSRPDTFYLVPQGGSAIVVRPNETQFASPVKYLMEILRVTESAAYRLWKQRRKHKSKRP